MGVNLKSYNNTTYNPGPALKRMVWYYFNDLIFKSYIFPINGLKVSLLRLFGAKIGKGVVIKPNVNIKYPWFLSIGDYSWIGEEVWIDCLGKVAIASNVTISQGAFLLTGSHNYKKSTFDVMISSITIEEGAWIGAKSIVCPGVTCKYHSILMVGSVATKDLEENGIYSGNPAKIVLERKMETK